MQTKFLRDCVRPETQSFHPLSLSWPDVGLPINLSYEPMSSPMKERSVKFVYRGADCFCSHPGRACAGQQEASVMNGLSSDPVSFLTY